MWFLAFNNARLNLSRLFSTLAAIAVGVGFFVGSTMIIDSIIGSLGGNIDSQYAHVDVAVATASDASADGPEATGMQRVGLRTDLLTAVQKVPGVKQAVGLIESSAALTTSTDATDKTDRALLMNWIESKDLNPLNLTDGRAPAAAAEVTIDRGTASDKKLHLGSTLTIATPTGGQNVTVVGLTGFGTADSPTPNGTVTGTTAWVSGLVAQNDAPFNKILVEADNPSNATTLRNEVRKMLPADATAVTGAEFRADRKELFSILLSALRPVLQGFAALALFVATFVIYNTFTVLVQQRKRELALLRSLAATPGQVQRSLVAEGALVGFVGGLIGLAVAVGLTLLIVWILRGQGADLPFNSLTLTPSNALTGVAIGIVVTTIASIVPAVRGSRVPPVAAMREVAVEKTKASRFRLIASAVGLAVGSGLMLLSDLAAFGGGALIFILSLLFIGPTTVQAFAAVTRPVMSRLGVVSRLSSQNLSRQPKRSAATSNALAIGLFLVTAVSLTGAGVKHWVTGKLNDLSSADFVVMTTAAELPPPVVNSINKITGLSRLLVTNGVPVTLDGSPTFLNAVSPAELKKFGVKSTFATSENNLGGGVAVVAGMGPQRGVGETVKFVDTAGRTISLKITAIVEPSVDTFSLGALVEPATLTKLGLESKPMSALMKVERGQKKAVQKQLNAATKGYSTVFVSEGNILGELVGQAFDFLLNAVNGLLGMSVLIAGIGIVNTLTLSVFERRRELGLLRAVGLTRRETRRMVRLEALQLSLLGTLVGMAAGALLAFLLLRKTDIGSYPIEWVRIGVIFAAGVAIGFLAAFFPARRATRMDVLEALAAE